MTAETSVAARVTTMMTPDGPSPRCGGVAEGNDGTIGNVMSARPDTTRPHGRDRLDVPDGCALVVTAPRPEAGAFPLETARPKCRTRSHRRSGRDVRVPRPRMRGGPMAEAQPKWPFEHTGRLVRCAARPPTAVAQALDGLVRKIVDLPEADRSASDRCRHRAWTVPAPCVGRPANPNLASVTSARRRGGGPLPTSRRCPGPISGDRTCEDEVRWAPQTPSKSRVVSRPIRRSAVVASGSGRHGPGLN
jgi:hypothetical protein